MNVETREQSVHAGSSATREELVARARKLQHLLRRYTAEAEVDYNLSAAANTALKNAGLFRMLVPKRFGGHESNLRTVLEVTEALGEADGSAAWLVGVASVTSWLAGLASEQAQQDLFGGDPDARLAGGGAPAPARRVEGGYLVSGRWSYSSGANFAMWATAAALVVNDEGEVDGVLCLVPASEMKLEQTWRTVGMRGTGSDTWIANDVFVPEHRVISMGQLAKGTWPIPTDEVMYRLPLVPLTSLPLLGPLLGIGRAALNFVIEKAPAKGMHHTFFTRQCDSVGAQIQIAEAALKLKTARLHAYSIADEVDAAAERRKTVDFATRAEYRAAYGYITQQVIDALTTLINVHGAAAFETSNPLQQYWRDLNTGARHAGLNSFVGYEIYGKSLLGIAVPISPMV
ncbi:acyl-CoA dehydrogenase family protein [Streptomyces sp. NPDC088847]|uniref:acyl-CoA dehydrogenase family protein n=1 Tax=Streptomyces sp. NPDC088847 TaxID=3365909 RepID=UPI003820D529